MSIADVQQDPESNEATFVASKRRGDAQVPDSASPLKVRFLITFDDGPHANTAAILSRLTKNSVQPDIKAIFFVQTRNPDGGASREGRALLHRTHLEGHVLGLHTGTARGHVRHTGMSPSELDQALRNGKEDISAVTGRKTLLVRPPYWQFNYDTLTRYGRHGLHMMLSDMKAYDGVNWGMHVFKRWNFRSQLTRIRGRFLEDRLPVVQGTIPIVVTFHDTNAHTAHHLAEYLTVIVDEADRLCLPLDGKPFYDERTVMMEAALRWAVHQSSFINKRRMCLAAQ